MNTSATENNEQTFKKIVALGQILYLKFIFEIVVIQYLFDTVFSIITHIDTGRYPDDDAPFIFAYNYDKFIESSEIFLLL